MPGLIPAVMAAIGPMIAGVTMEGLAIGATIVGTGAQLVGMATGSKTLQKIGTGFSMAGGVGLAANSIRGMSAVSGIGKTVTGAESTKGLLETNNMDDILSAPNKARAAEEGLNTLSPAKSAMSSADKFKQSAAKIGETAPSFDPELEKSYFQRANSTLTQYNPLMNALGGMGEAYMTNQNMNLQQSMNDKRVNIDQQLIDRVNKNNGTVSSANPAFDIGRNTNGYNGILGR